MSILDSLRERLGAPAARLELGDSLEPLFDEGLRRLGAHGDFPRFLEAVARVPRLSGPLDLGRSAPGRSGTAAETSAAFDALELLGPWRKGPFRVGERELDAEWRSERKWDRLVAAATPFAGRRVLDVGSGNGYYLLRLLGAGARFALGVEPSVLYGSQFLALVAALGPDRIAHLPLPLEAWLDPLPAFDTVLSMGVLYHRRDPTSHLELLREHLRPGGEVIVETLTYESSAHEALRPRDRYAKMRNVFAIPSPLLLEDWLRAAGFEDVELSSPVVTTTEEQRRTRYSEGPSLADFLDASDPTRTVEGYPAPVRRLARARKSSTKTLPTP